MFLAIIAAFDIVCHITDDSIPIKSTRYLLVGGSSSWKRWHMNYVDIVAQLLVYIMNYIDSTLLVCKHKSITFVHQLYISFCRDIIWKLLISQIIFHQS